MRLSTITLILACAMSASCVPVRFETYRDAHVSVYSTMPTFLLVPMVHADGPGHDLKVRGKTYRNVEGSSPHYLEVPALDSLLFVTEGNSTKPSFIHLVNTRTGAVMKVAGGESQFGRFIHSDPVNSIAVSSIGKADANGVELIIRYRSKRETEYLNLRAGALDHR